tara:strand:+ start:225 stop:392 length:168 start_codon:yes stop_codon:yes gene_type:complete
MAKEKVIQIVATDTTLFALTDKGEIFAKELNKSSEWTEMPVIENFKKKEDNTPQL